MMSSFREFMQSGMNGEFMQAGIQQDDMDSEKADIAKMLKKLPDSHAALVQGYNWKLHPGNTLNGDDEHVGYMDDQDKEIAVSSPWNYGREFTVLHEIAHRVWEKLVPPQYKKLWFQIVHNTQDKQDQSEEELFCHAYSNHYVKNRIVIHDHPQWHKFIDSLPQ